jgi:hypothetical protein
VRWALGETRLGCPLAPRCTSGCRDRRSRRRLRLFAVNQQQCLRARGESYYPKKSNHSSEATGIGKDKTQDPRRPHVTEGALPPVAALVFCRRPGAAHIPRYRRLGGWGRGGAPASLTKRSASCAAELWQNFFCGRGSAERHGVVFTPPRVVPSPLVARRAAQRPTDWLRYTYLDLARVVVLQQSE